MTGFSRWKTPDNNSGAHRREIACAMEASAANAVAHGERPWTWM